MNKKIKKILKKVHKDKVATLTVKGKTVYDIEKNDYDKKYTITFSSIFKSGIHEDNILTNYSKAEVKEFISDIFDEYKKKDIKIKYF